MFIHYPQKEKPLFSAVHLSLESLESKYIYLIAIFSGLFTCPLDEYTVCTFRLVAFPANI